MTTARVFSRNGATLLTRDVIASAPYVSQEIARRRLMKWEEGRADCDDLHAIPREAKSSPKHSLLAEACEGLGPRRNIEDLKPLSNFERRWLRKLEAEDVNKLKPYQDNRGRKTNGR